ncbi:MAG: hypothetical protein MH472_11305, partial [Bacteroidia bacterium]|nr:hypothetical protein [Bacteroidia bacterium]
MKKWKLLLPYLVNVLLVFWPPKNMSSCGFTIYKEEYRFWTFDPTISSQPGMQAFFYSMDFYHKGFSNTYGLSGAEELSEPNEFERNVKAWKDYCNKLSPDNSVIESDIYKLLYETNPEEYFKLYETLVQNNTFVKFYNTKPVFKKYIEIAKRIEFQCNNWDAWDCHDCPKVLGEGQIVGGENSYNWSDETVKPNDKVSKQIVKEAKVFLNETNSSFLRERFAFQLVRMGFYLKDSALVAHHYYRHLNHLPTSNWIKNSAAMYELNNYSGAEKNVRMLPIFESVPHLRLTCEKAFNHKLVDESLKLCKSSREQALLLVLHASHQHLEMLPIVEKIIQLEPNNEFLPSLFIREINKLEDWILGSVYTEFGSSKKEQMIYDFGWDETEKIQQAINTQRNIDLAYAQKVYDFLKLNQALLPAKNASFYELCLSHLAFVLKRVSDATNHLNKVVVSSLNEAGKTQFLVSKLMVSISSSDTISEESKQDFARVYKHLLALESSKPQYQNIRYDLCNFMAKECLQRNAAAEGYLLYGKSGKPYAEHPLLGIGNMYTQMYKHASVSDLERVLFILNKPVKTEFEKLLAEPIFSYTYDYYEQNKVQVDQNKVKDILSMKWVQQDNLLAAYKVLLTVDTAYWSNEVYADFKQDDPFWVSPNDGHDPLNLRGVQYNKVSFLKELIQLKNKAQKLHGEAKALALYKIANAYYSMGYAGKYWIMQKNYQLGDREYDNNNDVNQEYYQAQRARYYYLEALKHSIDPKLLALILFALDHAFYEFPGARQAIIGKEILKKKGVNPDFYEQLS